MDTDSPETLPAEAGVGRSTSRRRSSPAPGHVLDPPSFLPYPGFGDSLLDLAGLAHQAIPGSDGSGLAVVHQGATRFRSSNTFCRTVDTIQYRVGVGPCLDAVRLGRTIVSGSMGAGEDRWRQFQDETSAFDVRSVMSLPLRVAEHVLGSINVYSRVPLAFDAQALAAGEQFAETAASSLFSGQLLVETLDLAREAAEDLQNRATIERAIGLLASRDGLSIDAAAQQLVELSVGTDSTLLVAATRVLDQTRPPA